MKIHNLLLPILLFIFGAAACSSETQSAGQQSEDMPDTMYFADPGEPADVIDTEEHSIFVEDVVEGLGVPWGVAFLPNGNVLITEREGPVRIVEGGILREDPIEIGRAHV